MSEEAAGGLPGSQQDDVDVRPQENDVLHITFQTRRDDVLKALEVYDKKNKIDMHRNMEILGVFVVLWMFVPYAFEDPGQIVSWIMIAAALALLGLILFYPKHVNQKAAAICAYGKRRRYRCGRGRRSLLYRLFRSRQRI